MDYIHELYARLCTYAGIANPEKVDDSKVDKWQAKWIQEKYFKCKLI